MWSLLVQPPDHHLGAMMDSVEEIAEECVEALCGT